ncbi:AzlC family ABC transporter permease [Paenibacillaceae bacterium T2]|uniref:AzlC family ABC transporter permease n=2 Tax=Ferviditalea candida TaxID=3108399 RepID=A0ABU5ZIA0_9BACL|nr:AzlC family ABC transporter permease [Paenibacillaceae bacterium T2]
MSTRMEDRELTWYEGIKDALPTFIGYMSIGIAAGIVGASSNFSVLEIGLLSALVYAGAAQFIIFALLVQGTPISVIVFTTFIVNLRHLLMSMTLAPVLTKYSLLKNIGIGALLTDETFGVAVTRMAKKEPINDRWMYGLNLSAYAGWIMASVLGATAGKWISNPKAFGLDFALTAMFVALLVLQLQNLKESRLKLYLTLILYTAILMFILSMFVSISIAVLLSTIIAAAIGAVMDR